MVNPSRSRMMTVVLTVGLVLPLCFFWTIAFSEKVQEERGIETSVASFSMPAIEQRDVYHLLSTAYNSLENQTDDTPFITATGEQTQPGVIALSRDLLEEIPYGSIVEIIDIDQVEGRRWGCGATLETLQKVDTMPGLLPGQFYVADTMHIRKENQVDIWFEEVEDAIEWGYCQVAIATVLSPNDHDHF